MRLIVKDTGAGLTAEKISQPFQPFNRLGQERGAVQGTGIGLVVSKRLVELMGGVIGVESNVGAGSAFWFELVSASAPQLESGTSQPAATAQPTPLGPALPRPLLYA